jgi:WD40 repeat protein
LPSQSSRELFVQVLRACGIRDARLLEQWLAAWQRVRRMPGGRGGRPEPYRGLACYQAKDAEWYFGREALTRQLVGRLTALDSAGGGVQLVVGPSGSGKSSLLRAGLIPALAGGKILGSEYWPVVLVTPGSRPVAELAAGIAALAGASASQVADAMQADPSRWVPAALSGTPDPGRSHLTIVVDQFEEALTSYVSEGERRLFIAALFAAASGPCGAVVVLGLRADFYAEFLRHPQLVTTAEEQLVVGPMSEAELREAITGPAYKAKLELEEGLAELLLREVAPPSRKAQSAHEPGVLPLLSHALYATWDQCGGKKLTIADYNQAGGISGAVAASAGNVYNGLAQAQRELARRLFLGLVHIAADTADTRRRLTPAETLAGFAEAERAQLGDVLDQFVAARLITMDIDAVEISHETLLTAWPQLRAWLDTDRAGLVIGRQLTDAATGWHKDGHDPAALYRGTRLAAAQEWAVGHPQEQPPLVLEFLGASTAQQLGETLSERRRSRRRYQLVVLLTVLTLTAAGVGAYARQLQVSGERDQMQALSRLVAGEADRLRNHDISLSDQLALAAYQIAPTAEARSSLLNSTAVPAVTRVFSPSGVVESAADDSGKLLAAGTSLGQVQLWDVSPAGWVNRAGAPLTGAAGPLVSLAFTPGGHILAAGGEDEKVHLWNITQPSRPLALSTLTGPRAQIFSVAVSGNGQMLAAGSGDARVYLWNISNPAHMTLMAVLTGPAAAVKAVAFTPDGRILAAGGDDGHVHLWNVTHPAHPIPLGLLTAHSKIFSIAISPDSRQLAAGTGAEHSIYLWNISDPAHPTSAGPPLTGPTSWINSVAFSPDGTTLAAGSSDNFTWLFNPRTRQPIEQLPHPAPVTTSAYRNNGSLVTVAADGVLRIWALPGPDITGAKDSVFAVSFDASGHKLGIGPGADDNTLTVWNPANIQHPAQEGPALTNSPGPGKFSGSGSLTPNGRIFAVGCQDGSLQLWDISNPAHPARLATLQTARPTPLPQGADPLIESVTISNDGHILAAGSDDYTVHLIDIASPRHHVPLATLRAPTPGFIYQATFSPNGQLLAAASSNGHVYLWNIANHTHPQILAALGGFANATYSTAFSPDGKTLAAGSADYTVRLWDITDPHHPVGLGRPLTGPVGTIYSIAYEPRQNILAAGSTDSTIWLWDLTRPRQPAYLATLTGPSRGVLAVAFSPNQHTLAAGSDDRTVRLWDTNPQSAADMICATAGQPITRREWAQYIPGKPYQPPCR